MKKTFVQPIHRILAYIIVVLSICNTMPYKTYAANSYSDLIPSEIVNTKMDIPFVTSRANVPVYSEPTRLSEYGSYQIRVISVSLTPVTIVARARNKWGNLWGQLKGGGWIYMGGIPQVGNDPNGIEGNLILDFDALTRLTKQEISNIIPIGLAGNNQRQTFFINRVKPKGNWDVKEYLASPWPNAKTYTVKFGNKYDRLSAADIGNVLFAYMGRHIGYSLAELYIGAFLAGMGYEPPEDKYMEEQGYNYYSSGNWEPGEQWNPTSSPFRNICDVTGNWIGKTITLRAEVNGSDMYIGIGGNERLTANKQYTTYKIEDAGNGNIGIRSSNNKFVSSDVGANAQEAPMYADKAYQKADNWELYRIFEDNGTFYILSMENERWVQVIKEQSWNDYLQVRASGKRPSSWERFKIEEVGGSSLPSITPNYPSQPSSPPTSGNSATRDSNSWYPYNRSGYDKGQYKGDWNGDKPHGYGTLKYDSDNKYTISYSDGSVYHANEYVGNWSNGIKYGYGVLTYSNNEKYDGDWNLNGIYFDGYFVNVNGNRHKVKQTLRGDGITIDTVWIGDWESVNSTPTPVPAPVVKPTSAPNEEISLRLRYESREDGVHFYWSPAFEGTYDIHRVDKNGNDELFLHFYYISEYAKENGLWFSVFDRDYNWYLINSATGEKSNTVFVPA